MACIGDHRELGAGDRLGELPGAVRRETEILLEGDSQQGYRDLCPAGSVRGAAGRVALIYGSNGRARWRLIGWSAGDRRGHCRTDRYLPAWVKHVALLTETGR
jgi:hypothetical protein